MTECALTHAQVVHPLVVGTAHAWCHSQYQINTQEGAAYLKLARPAQIAGCGKDLWGAKSYYQRFRLCQDHLNLPSLLINGAASRFCQKCLYFHPLEEFDGTKKWVLHDSVALRQPLHATNGRLGTLDGSLIIHDSEMSKNGYERGHGARVRSLYHARV